MELPEKKMKMRRSTFSSYARIAGFILMMAVCSVARIHAQGYAKIIGTVTDPSGAVVSAATVTATQTATGAVTIVKTGTDGAYVFPALLPSGYSITVVAKGFEKFAQTGIVLEADQSATVNVKLTLGSSSETISVVGDAPQVDTTSGTLSHVIDEARVDDLPLNGRNAAALITLVAGVADATNEGNGVNQGNGKTFPAVQVSTANGTLPSQQNYLLNGGNNVDEMTNVNGPYPFPEAVQEFSVQTSNYNAEFGQSAGGVVNIITKSGAEKFHGAGFEFLRNGFFDARPYFATVADNYHHHQFGGVIGGPVIIPHFSNGVRTQFFFGYQHTIAHQNSNASTTTVPTLAEEGLGPNSTSANLGNLCTGTATVTTAGTAYTYGLGFNPAAPTPNTCYYMTGTGPLVGTFDQAGQISNPFTGVAYANNIIPVANFDPAAVAFEKVFPTFTGTEAAGKIGGTVNYFKPTTQFFNEYIARVDHQFSDSDHLFGHYYQNYYQQAADYVPTNLASYQSYFNTRYQNALLAETHTFTGSILNNMVLNYQREVSLRGGPPGSQDITAFGVQGLWQPSDGPYLAATVTGYFGASSSAFAAWGRNNYTLNDDLHWVKGNHNFAFGGHIELSKFDVTNVFQSYGSFGFTTSTAYPNAFANFQQGFMDGSNEFQQGNFELVKDRNNFPGLYAEDSWKMSHRITVNYGLRWEDFAPWRNLNGAQTAFNAANYVAGTKTAQFSTLPAGMVLSGDPGLPKNGVKNLYTQIMPRVGFAYDVFGNTKSVVRGGGGIFYQDRMPGFFNLSQASEVPNTEVVALSNPGMYSTAGPGTNPGGPFSDPYCATTAFCAAGKVANPFPFTLPFPSTQAFPNGVTVVEYDPSGNFQAPVTYAYNLTIEHQIASSWAARLAYVGSISRHQFVNLELNPAVNVGGAFNSKGVWTDPLSTNQRRVYNTSPTVGPCIAAAGCNANYSDIIEASMSGAAHFDSLQASLEKKMSRGLSLLLNYTWSKSLDDLPQATRVSNTEDLNAGESYVYPVYPAGAQNMPAGEYVADYKALDRGISDIDHPQVISASYVYKLPTLNTGNRILRSVANGWRTSGLIIHHSGDSLTAYMGTDNSLTGLSQDRAQRNFALPAYLRKVGAGDCQAGKPCVAWLNPAAFSVPVNSGPGTGYGNVVKGSLRGPGFTNWDGAVVRTFPLCRETNLEFRAEYFDLLNHTELGNPSVSNPAPSSTSFGSITGTQGGPRIAQFALKVTF